MGENPIVDAAVKNEAASKATGVSKEILSVIETQNSGFLVSISRSVKTGRTASEISTVKCEGYARDIEGAMQVMGNLDHATQQFVQAEAAFYGIDLKAAPNKLSPVENKKE